MLEFQDGVAILKGAHGTLSFPQDDTVTARLAMLFEGECQGLGATKAAAKYGLSRPRYYQLLSAFRKEGAVALSPGKRGPAKPSRRTEELVRQVIRHRFLDPDASVDVIAQKLRQCDFLVSNRTVWRVIEEMGIQKKTLHVQPQAHGRREDRHSAHND